MGIDEIDPRATLITTTSAVRNVEFSKPDASQGCLLIIYGADIGKRFQLGDSAFECGRSEQCSISLEDDAVSRHHAEFAWISGTYVVRDLGSTNGTYVNDKPVQAQALQDGDQIKIGRTIFKFLFGSNIELSYHEEIYRMMTLDGLTQIHNRRSFQAMFEREISRTKRYQRPLTLIITDIDYFKKINDEHGHLAGDAALKHVAQLMAANIRTEDTVARIGGEEFAILAPEVGLSGGVAIAEKLRSLIEKAIFHYENKPISITCSFGVSVMLAGESLGPEDILKQADERLYIAKQSGRNCVK